MPAYWGDDRPHRFTLRQAAAMIAAGTTAGIVTALLIPGPHRPAQPAPPAHGCVMWAHGADIMCADP